MWVCSVGCRLGGFVDSKSVWTSGESEVWAEKGCTSEAELGVGCTSGSASSIETLWWPLSDPSDPP